MGKEEEKKGKPTKESLYLLTQRFLSCEPPLEAVDGYTAMTTISSLTCYSAATRYIRSAAWMACECVYVYCIWVAMTTQ